MSQHQPPILEYQNPRRDPVPWPNRRRDVTLGILVLALPIVLVALAYFAGTYACQHTNENYSRVKCATNLRMIGQCVKLYSNDYRGAYPPNLALLYTHEELEPGHFVRPESIDEVATVPTTQGAAPTPQEIASRLANLADPRYVSYVYLGAGMTDSTVKPNTVIAHERPGNHRVPGMHVLYGDGHVDWLDHDAAQHLLTELRNGHNPPWP